MWTIKPSSHDSGYWRFDHILLALQGNAELADQPRQEEAANGTYIHTYTHA